LPRRPNWSRELPKKLVIPRVIASQPARALRVLGLVQLVVFLFEFFDVLVELFDGVSQQAAIAMSFYKRNQLSRTHQVADIRLQVDIGLFLP
jgi:hypothetical protein